MSNVFRLQLEAVNNMAACKKTCKIGKTHTQKRFFLVVGQLRFYLYISMPLFEILKAYSMK